VIIDKSTQTLRAYENGQLVMQTRVSTGKPGKETPNGSFRAQYKERMHYSSLYDNAPMPYSVNLRGHYFIHGYSHVPPYPASRGCIRLPLSVAPQFYNWITPGTPVTITGKWAGNQSKPKASKTRRLSLFGKKEKVVGQL